MKASIRYVRGTLPGISALAEVERLRGELGTKKEWKPDDEREQFDVIATEGTK